MESILMVLGVAGQKHDMRKLPEKTENPQECGVQPPGFEYRVVAQLVKTVQKKSIECPVYEKN